jgi:hypothetical protein
MLSCIGRDIEYRELELKRNAENVWEVVSDSYHQPEVLQDNIILLLSAFMQDKNACTGTPTELAEMLSAISADNVSAKLLSKRLVQNTEELANAGISFENRRSNGKRLITLRRNSADSDGKTGSGPLPQSLTLSALQAIGGGRVLPPVPPCVGLIREA